MIGIFFPCPFITFPAQKVDQFHLHQFGKVLTNSFSDIHSNHLKKLLLLLLNSLEKTYNFWYINFYFHRRFSFLLRFWVKPYFKEKCLYFQSQNLHKIFYIILPSFLYVSVWLGGDLWLGKTLEGGRRRYGVRVCETGLLIFGKDNGE
jgi:hypothetical protein